MRTNQKQLIIIYALSLLCLTLIIMVLPNWGQLQKSLDDPETIEEAIVRLIAQHNEEPESHLQEGQSLHNHSHNDVIDHPAFSVPQEKFSLTDSAIDYLFTNGSVWDTNGTFTSTTQDVSVYVAEVTEDDPGRAILYTRNFTLASPDITGVDYSFSQLLSTFNQLNSFLDILFGWGSGDDLDEGVTDGLYFRYSDDELTGEYKTFSTTLTTSPLSVSSSRLSGAFAIYVDYVAETVAFYYDSTLVGTLDVSDLSLSFDSYFVSNAIDTNPDDSSSSRSGLTRLRLSSGDFESADSSE